MRTRRHRDSWESFRLTSQQSSLFEVAAALCGAWSLLSEDDDFFSALDEARERADLEWRQPYQGRSTAEDAARRDFHVYLDVDKLLAQELVVLVQAGMNPKHVVRLVGDLRESLGREIAPPDGLAVQISDTKSQNSPRRFARPSSASGRWTMTPQRSYQRSVHPTAAGLST